MRVNAAISTVQRGAEIMLPAGTFSFSTPIVINKPVWLVGQGAQATFLVYTGPGAAVIVEAGSSAPYLAGGVRDLSLVGGPGSDATGVLQVDTIGFTYEQVGVIHFEGPDSAGIWVDNRDPSACSNCASGDSERTVWDRVSFYENTIGLKLTSHGGNNSFEYSWMRASHFQINNGQVGIALVGNGPEGSANLMHSDMDFMANVCLTANGGAGGTVAELADGAYWAQGFIHATAEQSCGASPSVMWDIDGTSQAADWGGYMPGTLGNEVAPGGVLAVGDTAPPLPSMSTGSGEVVLNQNPKIGSATLTGAALIGAFVPAGASLGVAGSIDASDGTVTLPPSVESGGAVIALPAESDTLVGRDTVDTLKNKTLISPNLVSPIIGGEQISAPVHATATFFVAGPLTGARLIAVWTPDHAITVTRVEVTAESGPNHCPQPAQIAVTQGSTSAVVSLTEPYSDSGPISVSLDASTPVSVSVTRGAACVSVHRCKSCTPPSLAPVKGRYPLYSAFPKPARVLVTHGEPPSNAEVVLQYLGN